MTHKITDSVVYVGVDDKSIDLFESQYVVPNGVSYNSYVILDDKIAVMDTVDARASEEWLCNLEEALAGKEPEYLVVSHMEPDHSSNIQALATKYPNMKIVGNAKTFQMISQFFTMDLSNRTVTVKEGDELSLGTHTLTFVMAPMVHWPEVMVAYEKSEKILFSADGFGKFGALDTDEDWDCEARRYYFNIVGKYGAQVQAALKKLGGLDIATICPLHGPVWRSDLGYLLGKYDLWSRYEPEDKAVAICYASMYGNTENAANLLANGLAEAGVKNIAVYDVSSTHVSTLISEVFRCSHIVLACPTYNNSIYPAMYNFIHDMEALLVQNRTVGIIQNGTWNPASGKLIQAELESMKNITLLEPVVTVKSSLKEDSKAQLDALKDAIVESLKG